MIFFYYDTKKHLYLLKENMFYFYKIKIHVKIFI